MQRFTHVPFIICLAWLPLPALAEEATGLPLPRFVSLRANEANVRVGPGTQYAIRWVYKDKSGMPMEIIEEFDHWRKVRDAEGDSGWIIKGMLSSRRTAIVKAEEQILRRLPEATSPIIARVSPGAFGEVIECEEHWCRLKFDSFKGWLQKKHLWGVYASEVFEK